MNRSVLPLLVALGLTACEDEEARGQVSALDARVAALETSLADETKTREAADKEATNRAGSIESRVAALEADKVGLAEQVSALQAELAASRAKLEQVERELAEKGTLSAVHLEIGVPECDEYVQMYSRCIEEKLPEAVRESSRNALETSVEAWRQAAATPMGREALGQACKAARDAVAASCGL